MIYDKQKVGFFTLVESLRFCLGTQPLTNILLLLLSTTKFKTWNTSYKLVIYKGNRGFSAILVVRLFLYPRLFFVSRQTIIFSVSFNYCNTMALCFLINGNIISSFMRLIIYRKDYRHTSSTFI